MSRSRVLAMVWTALVLTGSPIAAQGNLARRLERVLDASPYDRATWGIVLMDTTGRVLFERNGNRLFVPASNTKLVVTAAATVLLPETYRATTSLYGSGPIEDGVLKGDLVIYGRGDPTFSERCYGPDTLALGACEDMWSRMEALADSLVARGVRHIDGAIVGDGSHFDDAFVHPGWETYDLNWWYAAPVSALGFNDNSVNISWGPGPGPGAPTSVSFDPDLGNFLFENRAATGPAGTRTNIDFFRHPGTMRIWAQGRVAADRQRRTEYFALPDPNLYFAQAFRAVLTRKGVAADGPTESTIDRQRYRLLRETPALVDFQSRSRDDIIFPILSTSQNWFAETLLKLLGKAHGEDGSWDAGLAVERRFLIDSVGIDSAAFSLSDGSGLSSGNLIAPHAFAELLRYMWNHPNNGGFLRALPRSGAVGSLRTRFVDTPLEGRVLAKTGSIAHVNSLSGYIERERGGPLIFSVIANDHTGRYGPTLAAIDSVVVELGR